MSKNKNTTLTTTTSGYLALANNQLLEEVMAEECAGLEFTLDRVKLPAGGGTAFEVPSEDGEDTEMAKDITGVILYNHPAFAYYAAAFAGGHAAPDCSSIDGLNGVGTPGGDCRTCPFNKFGSGDGQSKLCKNKRMLYILREGENIPALVDLGVDNAIYLVGSNAYGWAIDVDGQRHEFGDPNPKTNKKWRNINYLVMKEK